MATLVPATENFSPPRSSIASKATQRTRSSKKSASRATNRKELELIERREHLREELPHLTKAETSAYRNSFRHNLCLDMLQQGNHRSFSEIFSLMTRQVEVREKAGPDSVLWNEVLLQDQPAKLSEMQSALVRAEKALRDDNPNEVYKSRHQLAMHFQSTGDKWLADHFFSTCLDVSEALVAIDNGQSMAEARCNVGIAMEENGDLLDAAAQFEEYCRLSEKELSWHLDTSVSFFKDACDHLTRIYTKLSSSGDDNDRLQYLLQAYNMAKKGGDEGHAGKAAYKLGGAYIRAGDPKTALQYLTAYHNLCEEVNDDIGLGKACEAIAKAHECEGNAEESVKFLKRFVEVAERSHQEQAIGAACSSLGAIFNSKGDYKQATEYFNKAFKIARGKGDALATSTSSVHYGIALAHNMMLKVNRHLTDPNKAAISRMLHWKDQRVDDFNKPLPINKDTLESRPSPFRLRLSAMLSNMSVASGIDPRVGEAKRRGRRRSSKVSQLSVDIWDTAVKRFLSFN